MKQGQILIIVLLVVVVILAVGLSVASRNITNLRTSTQTEQSQRAFTVAEGGVEDVLSRISTIPGDLNAGVSLPVTVGDLTANVHILSSPVYEEAITLDQVGQVDLKNYTGSQIKIEWAKNKNAATEIPVSGSASVEITLVYGSGVPDYSIARWFFPGTLARPNEVLGVGTVTSSDCISTEYARCKIINLISAPGYATPQLLRIKPIWEITSVRAASNVIQALPPQKYEVRSTAVTEIGVTRTVEVNRSALSHLPAVFDYALFSESDIIK